MPPRSLAQKQCDKKKQNKSEKQAKKVGFDESDKRRGYSTKVPVCLRFKLKFL